jgi:hypothetical protein
MRLRIRVLFALVLAACGGDSTSPPAPRLTTLTATVAAPSIVAGTTTTASVTGRDQQGQPIATGAVTWTSSSAAVATVDGAGTVTGVSAGNATLTATAGGLSASVALTVTPAPALARLVLALSTTTPRSGDRVTVTISGFDQFNAPFPTPAVTLSSTVPSVATVQADGSVVAALVGTATIRATVGAISASTDLTVSPGAPTRLSLVRPATGIFSAWRFGVQPQIGVVDAAGNRVITDAGRVVTVSAPGGVIGAATATTTAGLATFADAGVSAATGTASTLTFSATGLAPVEQAVIVAPFNFGGGTRLVGSEVRPGRYRSVNASGASCYWERLRNTTGSNDIIANSIGGGPRLVEIVATDVAIRTSGCATFTEVIGAATTSPTASFGNGVYLVGVDIAPGTWRADTPSTSCYWERLRNITGSDDIIANFFGSTPAIMTVLATDVAIGVSGCGTWTRVP